VVLVCFFALLSLPLLSATLLSIYTLLAIRDGYLSNNVQQRARWLVKRDFTVIHAVKGLVECNSNTLVDMYVLTKRNDPILHIQLTR